MEETLDTAYRFQIPLRMVAVNQVKISSRLSTIFSGSMWNHCFHGMA